MNAFIDRFGGRHAVTLQVEGQGIPVDRAGKRRMGPQGMQFGGEKQMPAELRIIQRLDAQPVAHQDQGLFAAVPKGDGEHADKTDHGGFKPPFDTAGQDYFGIGMAFEFVALGLQFPAQLGALLDPAIVGHDIAAIMGRPGLGAPGGARDDRPAAKRSESAI